MPAAHAIIARASGRDLPASADAIAEDEPERREKGTLFRFSPTSVYQSGFAAVALGIARATHNAFLALAMQKTPASGAPMLRDNPVIQTRVAQSEARLSAARAWILQILRAMWEETSATGTVSFEHRIQLRLASTYAIQEARETVETAYIDAGATAILRRRNPVWGRPPFFSVFRRLRRTGRSIRQFICQNQMIFIGVDCQPRNDMRRIGGRDLAVAHQITRIVQRNPDQTLIVVFGESHLATNHLPGRVHGLLRRKGIRFRDVMILQNVDAIYWKLQEKGLGETKAVQMRDDCYCVFNATPIEKYESFRQYLHKCIEEDSTGDWTLLAQTLIEVMTNFFSIKKHESVVDQLPSMPSMDELHISAAAEEFARRIHQACRGELTKRIERTAQDDFFVSVIENGLGYFCSKLLDSSRDGIESLAERVLLQIGRDDRLTRVIELLIDPGKRPGAQDFAALRSAIEAKAGKQKTVRMLSQLLGYALGRRLYNAYLESRISRKEIQALFNDPLNTPHRPLECYRELHRL